MKQFVSFQAERASRAETSSLPCGSRPGKRAHPHHPRHLRGLDLAWSVAFNPHGGDASRARQTADEGRQTHPVGTHGRQEEGRGDRSAAPADRGRLPPPSLTLERTGASDPT